MTPYIEDFQVGQALPTLQKEPITQTQLVRYAGASGDFNPLHTVEAVGRQTSFGGPIAHGMLVMGFMAQAVAQWVPQKALRGLQTRFVNVTRPGEPLVVTGKVTRISAEDGENWLTADVAVQNAAGEVKAEGRFRAVLPSRAGA